MILMLEFFGGLTVCVGGKFERVVTPMICSDAEEYLDTQAYINDIHRAVGGVVCEVINKINSARQRPTQHASDPPVAVAGFSYRPWLQFTFNKQTQIYRTSGWYTVADPLAIVDQSDSADLLQMRRLLGGLVAKMGQDIKAKGGIHELLRTLISDALGEPVPCELTCAAVSLPFATIPANVFMRPSSPTPLKGLPHEQ